MGKVDRPRATCFYRPDCNRFYVERVAEDGLAKDEWCFGFDGEGRISLRALFHWERASRRHGWRWVPSRCWFWSADDDEAREYLPDDAVPLPTDTLGPLVALVVVRRREG